MPYGTISSFDDIHGCGFIRPDDGSEKIKVSYREIRRKGYKILDEGQKVAYMVKKDQDGEIHAKNVVLL